ncbi:class I SAM-dependent methyltransferase [Tropicimonas marinistellae]|uniref:class I SAM-dependent methyltransferase n=1 Tax=Tropicimonas marinistellae TaxID=1739787 RepID=UPI0008358829|nr:methyltransferase domain-containing protein [Tropicimonas marinistellae]
MQKAQRMKEDLKLLALRAGEIVAPRKIHRVLSGHYNGFLGRALVSGARVRARQREDMTALEQGHVAFWSGWAGDTFHRESIDLREQLFREHHANFVDSFAEFVNARPAHSRLVEVGCGNGTVLRYCSEKMPALGSIIGLDLNATAVERAAQAPTLDPRTALHVAEAVEWLTEHPAKGTALLTYGGVFEYFLPEKLQALFSTLAANGPATVALVEPVATDVPFRDVPGSRVFGKEDSFSHNYPQYLEAAGFEVISCEEIYHEDIDALLVLVLAHCPAPRNAV